MLYYYLDILRKQGGHRTHDAIAVEHGADQGPLLHQYCRDSVSKTEIIMIMYLSLLFNIYKTRNLAVVSFTSQVKLTKLWGLV
jgi:hypothetical protein